VSDTHKVMTTVILFFAFVWLELTQWLSSKPCGVLLSSHKYTCPRIHNGGDSMIVFMFVLPASVL
jgi:hypothetical protein